MPAGVTGEVRVRGPMVAKGYTDPELSAASFGADGFFTTGDRGYLRDDGHLVLTGRSKEMIIRKGENISPREIEDLLQTHPKVAAVAVIGLPDRERGERVCAVVETAGDTPLTFVEMQEFCRDAGLMAQKIPEQLEVVEVLPRNATFKILKHELVAAVHGGRLMKFIVQLPGAERARARPARLGRDQRRRGRGGSRRGSTPSRSPSTRSPAPTGSPTAATRRSTRSSASRSRRRSPSGSGC